VKGRGDAAKAEEYFRKAMALDPGYTNATCGLSTILVEKGEDKQAESLLEGALGKYPGELSLYKDLIEIYIRQDHVKKAKGLCEKAASLADVNVGNIEDYLPIGIQAFQLGLLDVAGGIFEKLAEAKPWSGYVASNLASVYHAEKNYAEAEKYYKMAIKIQPANPFYCYNLGNLYYNAGEKDKAAASYREALGLDENFADAWYNLGYVSEEIGDFKEAERCYRKLKALGAYKKPLPHAVAGGRAGRV
jgi:tetratricopeptide (TPR) repeat protein